MAVRQYIGARYVPRFVGIYDVTQSYEALDVVDNGAGTSYIAKKPTPANTPLTNTDYWFLYGSTSGAIVNLQQQINDMKDSSVPGSLQNQIDNNSSNITNLTNIVDKLPRKAVMIGNSYLNGGLYDQIKMLYEDSRKYTGVGNGFLTRTDHPITFENLLDNAIADSSGIPANEVTDIIILSAWGETGALRERGAATFLSDMTTAVNSFKYKAFSAYPNLKQIRLAFVETRGHCTIPVSGGNSYYNEPFECNVLLTRLMPEIGIDYLGWVSFGSWMNDNMVESADHYHPNSAGNAYIGACLRAALCGSYVVLPRSSFLTVPFNITPDSTLNVRVDLYPDHANLLFDSITLAAGTTGQQYATIADFIDFSSLIASNSLTVPYCFNNKNLSFIDVNIDQNIVNSHPYKLGTYNGNGNGGLLITGAPFKAATAIAAGINRHIVQNMLTIPFTQT